MKHPLIAIVLPLLVSVNAVPQNTTNRTERRFVSVSHLSVSAGERVVSFQIEVTAGMVQAVAGLPIGWYVGIDNDPSWHTEVKGNITVGAAALSADEFQKIRLIVKKDETYLKFALSGTVSVTKDFEKERLVPLKEGDFVVSSPVEASRVYAP